jgi:hypothetical protein
MILLLVLVACSSLTENGIFFTNNASLVCGEMITVNDINGASNKEIRKNFEEILKERKNCPGTTQVEAENDLYNEIYK